jgi:Flp pilus assembly CpaF family ATPase
VSSFSLILPFIKPLEHLLVDPTVSEVMVNAGGRRVFIERAGVLEEVPSRFSTRGSRTALAWPLC